MSQYGNQDNAICKISECGFATHDHKWQIEEVVDVIQHCVASFAADPIVYGTHWPVCEVTSSIGQWIQAIKISLQDYPETLFPKLFYENAK